MEKVAKGLFLVTFEAQCQVELVTFSDTIGKRLCAGLLVSFEF